MYHNHYQRKEKVAFYNIPKNLSYEKPNNTTKQYINLQMSFIENQTSLKCTKYHLDEENWVNYNVITNN